MNFKYDYFHKLDHLPANLKSRKISVLRLFAVKIDRPVVEVTVTSGLNTDKLDYDSKFDSKF